MNERKEFLRLIENANHTFSGWDFSFISGTGRMASGPLDWSYGTQALRLMQNAQSLLDMGTGGGEFLSMLRPFPPVIFATEAYEPNIPLAKAKLEPMGVKVMGIEEDNDLPFENGQFDTIINKHEAYSVSEIQRILQPGGVFLTQQVGGKDCLEINEALGADIEGEYDHWTLDYAVKELKEAGLHIINSGEQYPVQRFYDIGALVYYLTAIPWQVEGFSAEKYLDELFYIHKQIEEKGYYEVKQHRFFIRAVNK
ncbi:class I SAM-dependent methyltransferase [Bacillus salacetis]|uniref:class I SAM-dependent methyltransferase n=1 Tax=Bacillus salacetis TaxID=2315464 RepID=UPI003BA0C073